MGSLSLRMFNLILVSCLLVQACQGLALARTDVRSTLGDPQSDAYIDQILENLRQMIQEQGLDPMTLPDLETGFSDTILGITWHGSATLRNGQFWGLFTIARTGDTSFTVVDNVTELTAMLGLQGPRAHYDAHAEFMGVGVSHLGNISVDISGLGPLDWILEILVDFLDEFFRG